MLPFVIFVRNHSLNGRRGVSSVDWTVSRGEVMGGGSGNWDVPWDGSSVGTSASQRLAEEAGDGGFRNVNTMSERQPSRHTPHHS